jgi:Peptidase family M48
MNVLRSLGPLTQAAHAISEKVGRRWFESSVNGLRLSERQLPDVFSAAIRAARIVGLPYLPEIYISGDQMWDAMTLGTENSAFIVIGSVLLNFKEDELLFVLGREMGHCRAGHALWKTVMQFISGRSQKRSIMGDGVLKMLNPAKLIENAIDAPLMAWSRHAEITADYAGVLCVGNEAIARRVLQAWTFRSFPLLQRMNHDAWMEQEDAADDSLTQFSEWTLASAPYLAGRLRLMREFARSEYVQAWRSVITHWLPPAAAANASGAASAAAASPSTRVSNNTPTPPDPNTVRLVCAKCNEGMRVPRTALEGTAPVNVRCPNASCRAVLTVTPKAPPAPPAPPTPAPAADNDTIRIVCAKCNEGMRIPASALVGKASLNVRCPTATCRAILLVKPKAAVAPATPTEAGTAVGNALANARGNAAKDAAEHAELASATTPSE